jgi:hypothetical protein
MQHEFVAGKSADVDGKNKSEFVETSMQKAKA